MVTIAERWITVAKKTWLSGPGAVERQDAEGFLALPSPVDDPKDR